MRLACRFGWHEWGLWSLSDKYISRNQINPERVNVVQMRACTCCGKTQFKRCV